MNFNMNLKNKVKLTIRKNLPDSILNAIRKIRSVNSRIKGLLRNDVSYLLEKYPSVLNKKVNQRELLKSKEFKIFSQNGEDGLLLHIFSKIGTTNSNFVEIGIEEGKECNTANLSINFEWEGILIDGDNIAAKRAKKYYGNLKEIKKDQIKIIESFVTKENVNSLIGREIKGEIDLLSIDVDGIDYHLWDSIEIINPRVVVIEYNNIFGDKSITVPYDEKFERYNSFSGGSYFGTSLRALIKLANKKGYKLVAGDSSGTNAFFVRKDISKNLKEISFEEAYYSTRSVLNNGRLFKEMEHLDFLEV